MSDSRPPRLAAWLLRLQRLGDRRAEIEADLHELYEARAGARGLRHARWRYYQDVLSLWRAPTAPNCAERSRRDATQPSWSAPGPVWFTAGILQDLAYAGRLVRRTPGVVVIAIAGLGVAIGFSTSIFSIVNGLAFKPSGIEDSRAGSHRPRRASAALGDSLRPITIGLGAGVLSALALSRVIAGALYGIGPTDPLAFGVSVAILLLSVLPAILIPARRATSVDPTEVLKQG